MRHRERAVTVEVVPRLSSSEELWQFFQWFKSRASSLRPHVVLDCSMLKIMDKSAIYLLVCCLEETMKRNGDVRLTKVSPESKRMLEAVGAARLFRIFASNAEAIGSYHQGPIHARAGEQPQVNAIEAAENAA